MTCPDSTGPDAITSEGGEQLESPLFDGFENGFCDYMRGTGFCYQTGQATFKIVDSPVHSGNFAAAFTVFGDGTKQSQQSRCVREGVLPPAAVYGAWYYIPSLTKSSALWNLFHFQGRATPDQTWDGLWDISLLNTDSGDLRLVVYDFVNKLVRNPPDGTIVPIGTWFHLQIFLKRASDATGEVNVYQDGVSVVHATNIITDRTNYAQWYVGNLAESVSPVQSTLYVDDVTVGGSL